MTGFTRSIHEIYDCREKFIIIGLTGRTGSGCSAAASILSHDIVSVKLPKPNLMGPDRNEDRKYRVIYDYVQQNWKPFTWIKIKDIITSFILENELTDFCDFAAKALAETADNHNHIKTSFSEACGAEYLKLHERRSELKNKIKDPKERFQKSYKFYFEDLPSFSDKMKRTLNDLSGDSYTRIYQLVGDNIRSSGSALSSEYDPSKIFSIAKRVNRIIKLFRKRSKVESKPSPVFVAIDALRNPFEALYFRERYSAFYLMAINTPDETRKDRLMRQFDLNHTQIKALDDKEYSRKKDNQHMFISQDIQKCYDLADIHINNHQLGEDDFTHLSKQLAKFVALIMHPGLIMPSRFERCMQIAHTAKLNSGCLSRQVGAAITDEHYSIKAIGWNTAAQGQTPCSLRSVDDLLNHEDKDAFSDYENNNLDFRNLVSSIYKHVTPALQQEIKGRNIPYCFKDIENCLDGQKNQVHTRSLHAEENAFLQISKYGGQGILGGILFTTSSPCELCSKKAYQLGIKRIYFIDPYPGIANQHILAAGPSSPELELFSGAIGRAYHQLYEPIMPYKDELELMLTIKATDPYKKLVAELEKLKQELHHKDQLIAELKEVNNAGGNVDEPSCDS